MIVTKTVKTNWHHETKEWYLKKGYGPYINGEELTVKVTDLRPGSHSRITFACDYCGDEGETSYKAYYSATENHITKKYACRLCTGKKKHEGNLLKNKQGLLKENDSGYYKIRENRLKALDEYIKEKGTIDGIWDSNAYAMFYNHNDDIVKALKELGYNVDELRSFNPKGYWDKKQNIVQAVESFILIHKRFPTRDELANDLRISMKAFYKHFKRISDLKKEMKYKSDRDLIDKKGDCNRSKMELIVANYLFEQQIPYGREEKPFPKEEGDFRSDFTLKPIGSDKIYVEVWGANKSDKGEFGSLYNQKRQLKESLYQKHKLPLISIDAEIFDRSFERIECSLHEIFSLFLPLQYEKIDYKKIIPASTMTEEELLNAVMKYSDNPKKLPYSNLLSKENHTLYHEVRKRYGTFEKFSKAVNVEVRIKTAGYWTSDMIVEHYIYMFKKYEKIIGIDQARKENDGKIITFYHSINRQFGMKLTRYNFYKHCITNNILLPEPEIKYIHYKKHRYGLPDDATTEELIENAIRHLKKDA